MGPLGYLFEMFVHQMSPILDSLRSGLCLGSSVVAGELAFYFFYSFLFHETSGGQDGREKTCPGAVGWETGKAEMGRCLQMLKLSPSGISGAYNSSFCQGPGSNLL